MKDNPIHKVISPGGGCFTRSGFKPSRVWAYTCPECGVTRMTIGPRASRKRAKDQLHFHMKEHNMGDSGEVSSDLGA